jgi:DNA polymerase elongation subunit (family B)
VKDVSKFNNYQMAKKILMNSLYGAMGNQGFRFFDPRIAEAITLTGQYYIRRVGIAIDEYVGKFSPELKDATFYQDTDSCYFTLKPLIEKFILPKLTNDDGSFDINKVIDAMDKIVEEKITPVINKSCDESATYTNSLKQLMNFKREALSNKGVVLAKKRYALNVHDNEGVRYATPKVKVMGLEIVRSSTPAPVRKMLKDAVNLVLSGSEKQMQEYCGEMEKKFMQLPPEQIAYPRGVQGLDKYSHPTNIYQKGCPIHVRAALMFNHLIKTHGIDGEYDMIRDGDKIKFITLKMPNKIRENVIGFVDRLPDEFNIRSYVDYADMWQKSFVAPLEKITDAIGWNYKEKSSLASLFG